MESSKRAADARMMANRREQINLLREIQEEGEKAKPTIAPITRSSNEAPLSAEITPQSIPTPETPSTASGGATPQVRAAGASLSPSANSTSALLMNQLISRGVKPEVAAGAIGSMMGESGQGLNHAAYNPNDAGSPSGGIAQWHGDRLQSLYKFAGVNDISKIPASVQAEFLGRELDTTHSKTLDALKKGSSVSDGTVAWTKTYEVPANVNQQIANREGKGLAFWEQWRNGSGNIQAANAEPKTILNRI